MPEDCSFGEARKTSPRGEQVSGQNTEISESMPGKEMAGAKALGPVQKQAARAEGGKKGGGKTTKSEIILG